MPEPPFIILPLDARPVCYDQVEDLAAIAGLSILMPPRSLLGYLKQPAPLAELLDWWTDTAAQSPQSAIIASLDTMAYGGLIAGRVNEDPLELLEFRVETFFKKLEKTHRPRYGFSSILRIPHYNNAEEEPDYWAEYGVQLYRLSEAMHQTGVMPVGIAETMPRDVVEDFLKRREKNFRLNFEFLHRLTDGSLDFLIYCQDDTGPYGLNVQEAETLQTAIADDPDLDGKALVQTGADEVASLMLAKALWHRTTDATLTICPLYYPASGKDCIAKFDGMPVGEVVSRHIRSLGAQQVAAPEDADLVLLVNAPTDKMGDHCGGEPAQSNPVAVNALLDDMKRWLPRKNVSLADVVNANGADAWLMQQAIANACPVVDLAGYGAWNTPGNAIGTALAFGAIVTWARQRKRLNDDARRRLLMKRLLDDWLYQAEIRTRLRSQYDQPEETILNDLMRPGAEMLRQLLHLQAVEPRFTFPCARFFEIAVAL